MHDKRMMNIEQKIAEDEDYRNRKGRSCKMKEIINEYGSMVLAVTGLILFFGTMGAVVLARSGLLMQIIQTWMYGGV